jgi:hypothetical protein
MPVGKVSLPITQGSSTPVTINNRVIPHFQEVSYRTGDLAWHWANGTYDYNDSAGIIQELDPLAGADYFFRLKYDNPFGNKFRLTDDQGVPAPLGRFDFPVTNDVPNSVGATPAYFIDNLTGLGFVTNPIASLKNWNDSIDAVNSFILGPYSDFRGLTAEEALSLLFDNILIPSSSAVFEEFPFNRGGSLPNGSFDSGGIITNFWLISSFSSTVARLCNGNFRARITDQGITITAGIGTYGVRTHF